MNQPSWVQPTSLADYFEAMARAIFVSGMSWKVIDAKWDGIRQAFDGFDPKTIAAYTPNDVERLLKDTRIIRNRKKVEAIIRDAGEIIVVDREFGGFKKYLESFADNDDLVRDLHKRFAFLGESVAHFFLFGMTEPEVSALAASGYHPGEYYESNPTLKSAIDLISSGIFSNGDRQAFEGFVTSLWRGMIQRRGLARRHQPAAAAPRQHQPHGNAHGNREQRQIQDFEPRAPRQRLLDRRRYISASDRLLLRSRLHRAPIVESLSAEASGANQA